jgi:hypothetical protein
MFLNFLLYYNTFSRKQRYFLIGIITVFFVILSETKIMQQSIKDARAAQKNYVAQCLRCKQYQQQMRHAIPPARKPINVTPTPAEWEWVGILAIGAQYWAFLKQADQTIIGLSLNQHVPGSPWQIIALTKNQIVLEHRTTHTQWIKDFT